MRPLLLLISVCAVASAERPMIQRYCAGCHNNQVKRGGLSISDLKTASPEWEKVVLKLRAGMMPPAGAPRPDPAAIDALAASIEKELDQAAAAHRIPVVRPCTA